MPRIRTIKPEFWQDEKVGPLKPIDRLTFLGLISQADDAGRLVDNPRLLNGLLFPYTKDDCDKSIETLARLGRVLRYCSNSGQRLLQIVNWQQHQRVDNPSKYTLPPPPPEVEADQPVTEPSGDPSEGEARAKRDDSVPTLDLGPTTNDLRPAFENDFLVFWEKYPLKVGKKDALANYQARRREGTPHGAIMDGLARYLPYKKAVGERHHYPATFLGPKEWWTEPWHIPEAVTVTEETPKRDEPTVDPKFREPFVPDIQERKPHPDLGASAAGEVAETIMDGIQAKGATK